MKNEIDQTVERIGQLPDAAIESERGKAWREMPAVPLLCEMDEVGEQIPDPRIRAMAMVNIGFKRGYDSRDAEITQLKADLATAKQGLEDMPRLVPTNWLDPLLSGDEAVVKTCDNREIEALLLGIQTRQRDAAKLVLDAIGKE